MKEIENPDMWIKSSESDELQGPAFRLAGVITAACHFEIYTECADLHKDGTLSVNFGGPREFRPLGDILAVREPQESLRKLPISDREGNYLYWRYRVIIESANQARWFGDPYELLGECDGMTARHEQMIDLCKREFENVDTDDHPNWEVAIEQAAAGIVCKEWMMVFNLANALKYNGIVCNENLRGINGFHCSNPITPEFLREALSGKPYLERLGYEGRIV